MKKLIFLFLPILFITSCATYHYHTPDSYEIAYAHKKIAIVPPSISIAARKKIDAEAMIEQQKTESLNFQREIFRWFLLGKKRDKIDVELLDIQTTNAKLESAGFYEVTKTPKEICEILDVDGIIISNFSLSKPMSNSAAIAVSLLGGVGSTNQVNVSFDIHDRAKDKMIFNYSREVSGGIGSSHKRIVDYIFNHCFQKLPYTYD